MLTYCSILLLCLSHLLRAEDEWRIPLEQKIGENDWTTRGDLLLFSSRVDGGLIGRYDPGEYQMDDTQKESLLGSIKHNQPYMLRCASNMQQPQIQPNILESFAMSFTEPNRVVQSNLQEVLTLSVDMSQRRIMSLTVQPIAMDYDPDYEPIMGELSNSAFNTTLRIVDVLEGPAPETLAYIQKIERERQSREEGDGPDNRSFLAKYWMYIVPVVIFLMVSSSMAPEEGGQAPAR